MDQPRTVLVTGGSRGIGKAIVSSLLERGVRVAVGFRTTSVTGNQFPSEASVFPVKIDIESRDAIRSALSKIESHWGPIDVLVNNAAMAQEKLFEEITDEDWDHMMMVNLRGAFALSQEVIPSMTQKGWGRIVNLVSIGGQWGGENQVHYAAAKAGLISLTRSLARIYSSQGVTINAVSPGLVETEMAGRELNSEAGREKVKHIPIGRPAVPQEVAEVVAFLSSEEAQYITGQTINVNGGMYFG